MDIKEQVRAFVTSNFSVADPTALEDDTVQGGIKRGQKKLFGRAPSGALVNIICGRQLIVGIPFQLSSKTGSEYVAGAGIFCRITSILRE